MLHVYTQSGQEAVAGFAPISAEVETDSPWVLQCGTIIGTFEGLECVTKLIHNFIIIIISWHANQVEACSWSSSPSRSRTWWGTDYTQPTSMDYGGYLIQQDIERHEGFITPITLFWLIVLFILDAADVAVPKSFQRMRYLYIHLIRSPWTANECFKW